MRLAEGMFEHPNPPGFQLVFHFLAVTVAGREVVAALFRDCWPVTDRKQEAEYRRLLAGLLRDWGRQWPGLLPPHPPASLLQSPGGRYTERAILTASLLGGQDFHPSNFVCPGSSSVCSPAWPG